MAHGLRGCIVDKNRKLISINDIIIDMDTPEMQGKPKVLLIPCCQSFPDQQPEFGPNASYLYNTSKQRESCYSISARSPPHLDSIPFRSASTSSTNAASSMNLTGIGNALSARPPAPTHAESEMEGQPIELRKKDFTDYVNSQ